MGNTLVFTVVVADHGEGKEPSISHSMTVNGKPVEGALAVISVGQLPGVFVSGAENTNEMRQIALQASGLAARMQDTALGAAIGKALEVERKVTGEQPQAPAPTQPENPATLAPPVA